ncbi:MAG: ABC transporter permease [Bryobacteraceae bacterium]
MRLLRILQHRLSSALLRHRAEADLDRELALHFDELVRTHVSEGMDGASARAAARREFGSTALAAEHCRDQRRVTLWEDLVRDAAHAVRSLLRAPAFTIAAVLTVALGIGVNTAVFSVVHSVLLDPLPYRDPERLVHLASTHPSVPTHQSAAPDLADWQRMSSSFENISAFTFRAVNKWTVVGDGEPEIVQVVQASAGLFDMLGAKPLLGRTYTVEEERSRAPVVMIGESLWRRRYAADPKIIGRTIRLVTWPVTVIGVVSQSNAQPEWADVWMSLAFLDPALTESRKHRALEVIGRLKAGVTLDQAQQEMSRISADLERAYPATNGRTGIVVTPLASWMTGEVRPALLIAWSAAGLVLLLACANVAHLVLVRTIHRSRELAVRSALGAASSRLARLLLVENAMVAAAGALLGAAVARFALPLMLRGAAVEIPRLASFSISPAALRFGIGAAFLCAILFALPAIFHARGIAVLSLIKQSSGVSIGRRRSLLGPAIIAAEVALAFLVISAAGLLYRSFSTLVHEPTGFDSKHVLAVDAPLGIDWEKSAENYRLRVAPRLRAIPGVTATGAANLLPMSLRPNETTRFSSRFGIVGQHYEGGQFPVAQLRWVTPDYFDVLRIPMHSGRAFTEHDRGNRAFVINETLARRFFPGSDPVGQRLLMNVTSPKPDEVRIIGVVADVRDMALDFDPAPAIYELLMSNRAAIFLRTKGDPTEIIPAVRAILHDNNPDAPLHSIGPLEGVVERSLALRRFALGLIGTFAALAILLTAIGVYGIVSYSLSQRISEFAIRFALGARRAQVHALVFGNLALPAAAGLALGWALHSAAARLLGTQLYKLSPNDPVVLASAGAALLTLVLGSALRPTARASGVSPASILRE